MGKDPLRNSVVPSWAKRLYLDRAAGGGVHIICFRWKWHGSVMQVPFTYTHPGLVLYSRACWRFRALCAVPCQCHGSLPWLFYSICYSVAVEIHSSTMRPGPAMASPWQTAIWQDSHGNAQRLKVSLSTPIKHQARDKAVAANPWRNAMVVAGQHWLGKTRQCVALSEDESLYHEQVIEGGYSTFH